MNTNTERDELAEVLANARYSNLVPAWPLRADRSPVKFFSRKEADAVLAAGYTKPRTINTAAELDALPSGTKLFAPDTGEVWWVRERHDKSPRWQGSGGMYTHTSDLLEYQGELTVLYTPEPTR